jgi:eukaryotic-like serine/threonine-protein kinase
MNPERWKQVEAVLQSAMDRGPDDRDAFLREACAGDAALESEVRSLLASDREAGSFLDRSPASGGDTTATIFSPIDRTISHYRVIERLGAGGMGVVYKAEDSRLGRFVALKFLSEELAHDSQWMSRFEREARVLASLNHPSIAVIYGLEKSNGLSAIAMELVEGPTLAESMAKSRIPIPQALSIAARIAEALEYAHEHGIVHRDLKPGNVKLRNDGAVKVLDFGLAKTMDQKDASPVTTHPGAVVGTPAYMAPEHAAGLAVDRRADIWAFGVVLFEMLAGCHVFARKTSLETMAAIARDEPPWDKLPQETPAAVVQLLRRCLDKDPKRRLRDIGEARIALEHAEGGSAPPVSSPAPRALPIRGIVTVLGTALLLGAAALLWFRRPVNEAPRQVVQFEIASPPGTIYTPLISRQAFAISPDGKRLAFTATGEHGTHIWIRELASSEPRLVPGTEDAWSIFWSPDSRSIFFGVRTTVKQVNLDTGSGRNVAEVSGIPQIGTWRSNGDLLIYLGPGDTQEVHLEDGSVRKGPSFGGIRWPQILPGDRMVYTGFDKALQHNRAFAADYDGRTQVPLMQTSSRVQYAPPLHSGDAGDLVFVSGTSLLSQPFDADRMQLAGKPFPIASNVIYFGANLAAAVSVSQNGVLVYQGDFPNSQLTWYDRTGKPAGNIGRPAQLWGNVRISRDGKRVAASVWNAENGSPGIWTFDASGKESRRVTFPPEIHVRPVWSPDGTEIACGRSQTGAPRLATLDLSGTGEPQEFEAPPKEHINATPTDWYSDGRFIVLDDGVGNEHRVVWIGDVSSRKVTPLLRNEFPQWGAAFSPDGKRIAFVSLESGRAEVYVQAFDSGPSPRVAGERRQVSSEGGWLVRWRGDGRELFYLGLDNVLHAVPVNGPFEFGKAKSLFRIPGAPQYGTTRDFQFDVSPDGQRFLIPTTGSISPPPFSVIENWQDKFRR